MFRLRLPVLTRAEKSALLMLAGILGSGGALRAWEHSGIVLGPVRDWDSLQRLIVQAQATQGDSTFPCFTPPPASEAHWPNRSQPLDPSQPATHSSFHSHKKSSPASPLNLNTVAWESLVQLPGVGPSTAKAIVASRDADGPFHHREDLLRVKGIGPKKFAALREFVFTDD